MTARVLADDDEGRAAAIAALRAGGVVALPTDTVYGIAVSLATADGVDRLIRIKRRPTDKGIALLIDDAAQAEAIGVVTPAAGALAEALWPGGLTLILDSRHGVGFPDALTGGSLTIGLRVPAHDAPRTIARAVGPLPTTSANVSGEPEARDATEIVAQLGDAVDLILDGGPAHGGPASTVVDCTGDGARILRVGAIPAARVREILHAAGIGQLIEAHPEAG